MENPSDPYQKYNKIAQAIIKCQKQPADSSTKKSYLDEWLVKHPNIFSDGIFYTPEHKVAKLVIIFAYVGCGKTYFATKTLNQFGKRVFFNCSRSLIKIQQKLESDESQKIISNKQAEQGDCGQTISDDLFSAENDILITNRITFATSWSLYNPLVFDDARMNYDYIVVDEAHHLFSDSFCDAPNYVHELLMSLRDNQTVILMTACADYLTQAFKIGFDLPLEPVCVVDVRDACISHKPKEIKIINYENAIKLIHRKSTGIKRIYFCRSARRAYKLATETNLSSKLNAIALTSSPEFLTPHMNKAIIDHVMKLKELVAQKGKKEAKPFEISKKYDLLTENLNRIDGAISIAKKGKETLNSLNKKKYPENIDIIFTTSKLREGINIEKGNMSIEVFTEALDQVDLIQVPGRLRVPELDTFNIDCLYLVMRAGKQSSQDFYDNIDLDHVPYDFEFFHSKFGRQIMDYVGLFAVYFQDTYRLSKEDSNIKIDKNRVYLMTKDLRRYLDTIYRELNSITWTPGRFWIKIRRSSYVATNFPSKPEDIYSLEFNPLWEYNYRILHENDLNDPNKVLIRKMDSSKLKEDVEGIFEMPVQIIDELYTKYDLINIINKYKECKLKASKIAALRKELIEIGFIDEKNHLWQAIRRLGCFTAEPVNSKRQTYIIKEMKTRTDDIIH